MELEELVRKIQKTDILSANLSRQKLAGAFHSMFKGRGLQLDSVRKYVPGDDIRAINWNVTARFREPFLNTFTEDRERLIWLMVDVSGSSTFGTRQKSKLDQQIEIAATLAYAGVSNGDRVGLIFFSDRIEKVLEPARGMTAFWRIAKELVAPRPVSATTDLAHALQYFMNLSKKSSIVFLISDFLADNYATELSVLAQKHDLTAIRIYDEMEQDLPDLGWVRFRDAETNQKRWVNTSSSTSRKEHNKHFENSASYFSQSLRGTKAGALSINTADEPALKLMRFMNSKI